jgi:DNA polymerase-1
MTCLAPWQAIFVQPIKKEPHGNTEVMIVTGDLDTLQLVNDCVHIYTLRKGLTDVAVYDPAAVKERYGLNPSQMIDYKALRGDPSDNIKGVTGIGEKGAIQLIQDFGSIEELYKAIHDGKAEDKMKPRTLTLLTEQEEQARQSYHLSKIVLDVPLDIDIPVYEFTQINLTNTSKLFQELEFHSMLDKVPKNYLGIAGPKQKSKKSEPSAVIEQEKPVPLATKGDEEYVFVHDKGTVAKLLKALDKKQVVAIDTETTSINTMEAELVGASFSAAEKKAFYVPAAVLDESKELIDFFSDKKVKKVGHNIKYDYMVLANHGIVVEHVYFDTMIASFLLNAGTRQHGLDALAFNELGYQMQPIEDLIGKGKKQITLDEVDPEKVSWYASEDADITLRLYELYHKALKKEGLEKIFYDIEMPLIPVLASMETCGIKLDSSLLEKLGKETDKTLKSLVKEIHTLAGEEFNLNSPIQLREILFVKLGLAPVGGKKTKTGMSTAAAELEKMRDAHPIIEKMLQYRELAKIQSTYILSLPEMVNKKTGRIHTSYNQTIAATGRLSSVDPNLQNIPIRGTGIGSEIRKAFVAEKGWKLLSLDYSQIELRVIAHLASDKAMLKIFKNDEDIHTNTAVGVFGVDADKVTGDMRRDAKTINFGILYGLSAFGLSSRIGSIEWHSAKEFIDKYFAAYPGVKKYIDQIKEDVRKDARITNELGRIRKFPEINASNFMIRQAAERQAVNFPIQSLAADVIKVAMIDIYDEIRHKGDEIKMLLQVHDELVFEVREDKVEQYIKTIQPLMENAIKLSVPVRVEAKVGDNWGEMEKIKE